MIGRVMVKFSEYASPDTPVIVASRLSDPFQQNPGLLPLTVLKKLNGK